MNVRIADPYRVTGWAHSRYPVFATNAMVATSQPFATCTALDVLKRGGNAADAAVTAAATLCVLEPMWTGIGGDCFALVWEGNTAVGLDAAGPAPASASPSESVEIRGPRSVTVPGAVAGWDALLRRYGTLELGQCLETAIKLAAEGYPVSPIVAWHWANHPAPAELTPIPAAGKRFPMGDLAESLRTIALKGVRGFYQGRIAEAITKASWLSEDDLATYQPRWVEPISASYRGFDILELPAPTQGIAVLEALKLLEPDEPTLPARIRAMRLALDDAKRSVRDDSDLSHLIEKSFVARRRRDLVTSAGEPGGGTIYVCVVDGSGMAVSFIQSLYMPFGSRVVAKDTGILLQNRAAGFSISGAYEPRRRPYHTTIPALVSKNGRLSGVFGVVGGFVQAQAHLQVISNIVDLGLDPQEALDRPRFFIDNDAIRIEQGLWPQADNLVAEGFKVFQHGQRFDFGGGQAIFAMDEALVGGSDSRKDGFAAGY